MDGIQNGDILSYLRDVVSGETASLLTDELGIGGVYTLHQKLGTFTDSMIGTLSERAEPGQRADCGVECGWCCHLRVSVPVPSLFALSRFRNLSEVGGKPSALSSNPMMAPCRFLDASNRCKIYADRPFGCRSHSSLSARACRDRLTDANTPDLSLEEHRQIGLALRRGVGDGLEALGLDRRDAAVDLRLGLDILWSTEEAWQRWRGGDPLFAPAWFDVEGGVFGSGLFPLPKRDPLR